MESKPFYCKVVDMRITGDVCEKRIKQAKEFRDKGEPHASLNKCIICKGLTSTKPTAPAEEPIETCPHCQRPRVYKKARWNTKRGMHVDCYVAVKKGGKPRVKVERPALGVKVTTVEPPAEDPERIIQCSAPPSWVRCHGCYAVKNCAIYDEAVSGGLIVEQLTAEETPIIEQPAGRASSVPDTSEQSHYTSCAIQPIDFIVANNMDFLEGNVIKYVARYKNKNGLEDLAKARHYLDMLIKREEAAANE